MTICRFLCQRLINYIRLLFNYPPYCPCGLKSRYMFCYYSYSFRSKFSACWKSIFILTKTINSSISPYETKPTLTLKSSNGCWKHFCIARVLRTRRVVSFRSRLSSYLALFGLTCSIFVNVLPQAVKTNMPTIRHQRLRVAIDTSTNKLINAWPETASLKASSQPRFDMLWVRSNGLL